MTAQCSVDDCDARVNARGMCGAHYQRARRGSLPMPPKRTAEERFWAKVDKTPTCWVWTAAVSPLGYGAVNWDGRMQRAHRVAYEMAVGPIPDGLVLDHLCRNPWCVNPEHLDPVTNDVNTLRGIGPTAINKRKTRCKRGHVLDEANTYIRPTGYRLCRTCNAAAQRATQARRRAAA